MSVLALLSLLLLHYSSAQLECHAEESVRLSLSSGDRDIPSDGYPEVCLNGEWRRVCTSGRWTEAEASVACRQLGYSDQGASTVSAGCPFSTTQNFVEVNECSGKEDTLHACGLAATTTCCSSQQQEGYLLCQLANCANGALRLAGGSSANRDGRVELCINGRWRAVCNIEQRGIAEAICSQLRLPTEGASTVPATFATGPPFHSCTVQDGGKFDCTADAGESCDQILGVQCNSGNLIAATLVNPLSTVPPRDTDPESTQSAPTQSQPTAAPTHCNTSLETAGNRSQEDALTGVIHLYVIVVVLSVFLILTTIGWICTYAVYKRRLAVGTSERSSNSKQEVLNPIYTQATPSEHKTNKTAIQRSLSDQRVNTYDTLVDTRGLNVREQIENGVYTTIATEVSSTYNALVHNGCPQRQNQQVPVVNGPGGEYSKLKRSQTSQSLSF